MAERFANRNWHLANDEGNIGTWERVSIAVLMDVRDELQRLNSLLNCPRFMAIPTRLQSIAEAVQVIDRNTRKRRRKRRMKQQP